MEVANHIPGNLHPAKLPKKRIELHGRLCGGSACDKKADYSFFFSFLIFFWCDPIFALRFLISFLIVFFLAMSFPLLIELTCHDVLTS